LSGSHIAHLDKETFKDGLHKPNFHEHGMHKPMVSGTKKFDTGFHYLLHCHELGGKAAGGGYGGPLCDDPYGAEVRGLVDELLKEAEADRTLCYNNFKDPCPRLTKEQVALCKGHDYGDKTAKLPMGPLPWPTGLPEPGYVPKTDPLHGRWITVSGGQKEFIKAAIKSGMLGKAESDKIIADTDHHQTGGMYLRINQFGDVCTVDASVAKFARAKRTWKSGHYFYEPLVSGGNLLGVWVLPEEYRKIGFFWEMGSGRNFRIERRAFPRGGYMFLRQATEVNGKISFVFYVKVDDDPGSAPIPLQSRDYTALAGMNNTKDNLGNVYPCTGKDLDYPKKRDTWLDTNKKEMLKQRKIVAKTFARVSTQEHVGMGWTCDPKLLDGVTIDSLWEALAYKARNPQEFMDVDHVATQERAGFLWRSMMVKSSGNVVIEHIYCKERRGEMIYRVVDFKTKRETDDERVLAVKEEPLRLEFFHRHRSDGYRSYWQAPVKVVENLVTEIAKLAKYREDNQGTTVGLGVHSPVIEGVSHDAMWKAMIECVREPQRFYDCKVDDHEDCEGYVKRTVRVNGKTASEHIYTDEGSHEIVYRVLDDHGKETDVERVVSLRSHPLEIEFHCCNVADGFRVEWEVPCTVAMALVDKYIEEAKRFETQKPTVIGYGLSSDPISECNYDSLFIAIDTTITDPTKAIDVEDDYKIEECDGYIMRTMTIKATGERVREKVTVNEEIGEVVYCKQKDGKDGKFERCLAIHTGPLRMEMYERNTFDDTRCEWKAPYTVARETFERIVRIAKEIDSRASDVVGYGMSSKPLTGTNQDCLWRSMLFCVRNPKPCGMNVANVKIADKRGFMQRSMTVNERPGKPTQVDNIYVDEKSQEIIYRTVVDGKELEEERVFCARKEPLRNEIYSRHTKDSLRVNWQAPKAVVGKIFTNVADIARLMYNDPKTFEEKFGQGSTF